MPPRTRPPGSTAASLKVTIEGITPAWGRIRNRSAEVGRYLVDHDVDNAEHGRVIGKKLKEEVFGNEEALGREILIAACASGSWACCAPSAPTR